MNRNFVFIVVVILAITGLLFAGKYLAPRHPANAQVGGKLIAGQETGAIAPDFELTVIESNGKKKMKLSELRGKGVILDFWATYCEPCKIEMPWFVDLQK